MVVLNITELLHSHKKAEQLVRAGQRVRIVRRGRSLFDLVPSVEARPQTRINLPELNRAMTQLARKAQGRNLISALRQEREL
jgi:antitoxin (DNA-binding transcriptional repressor) of toxin-antitoxin stability system